MGGAVFFVCIAQFDADGFVHYNSFVGRLSSALFSDGRRGIGIAKNLLKKDAK